MDKPVEHARLQSFFDRLAAKDFETAAKELPPSTSPTRSRFLMSSPTSSRTPVSSSDSDEDLIPLTPESSGRTLSMVSTESGVAIAEDDHEFTFQNVLHEFLSLEEMQKMAAHEIVRSQKNFQPLPDSLRSRKMSITVAESPYVRSPKKPRMVPKTPMHLDRKEGKYHVTGDSDEVFSRPSPRKQDALHARRDSGEEAVMDYTRAPLVSEALVLNFMREMHERNQSYSSVQELDLADLKLPVPHSNPGASFVAGETRESMAIPEDRPMKRRLPDWTSGL